MKKFWKVFGSILLVVVLLLGAFIAFLSIKEFKPEPIEKVDVVNNENRNNFSGDVVSVLSYNVGFAGLGDNADFFMDGGKQVFATDEKRVEENFNEIVSNLKTNEADFYFLQEVDKDSRRTYHFDEVNGFINDTNLAGVFAMNYSCPFVPYPVPPLGEINSGLLTLSNSNIASSERISLPCPFKWPVSTANLKRCLLISRVPIENSDKELVMVNLHLEAYDNGEGKEAQTKMLFSVLQEEYEKGNYVIAGGDFNQTFPGSLDSYPILNEETWTPSVLEESILPEGWTFAYDNNVPSCRLLDKPYDVNDETAQHYIIDGFILSPNVETVTVDTLDLGFHAADHNPVYLNAKLK